LVGLSPVTLRAWERRYRLRAPIRTRSGYRLYSDEDVATLRWLKSQAEAGIPLAHAALMIAAWAHPQGDLKPQPRSIPAVSDATHSLAAFAELCLERLLAFDDKGAEEILSLAAHSHSTDAVVGYLIPAVLREVGERWQRQQATIAGEHFASQCLTRYLMHTLHEIHARDHAPRVLAACAPGEQHQIGLLVLAVLLARAGVEVVYLGADMPLERLEHSLRRLRPRVILFSATRRESAHALSPLQTTLHKAGDLLPAVVLGGLAFDKTPTEEFPFATILTGDAPACVDRILHRLTQESIL